MELWTLRTQVPGAGTLMVHIDGGKNQVVLSHPLEKTFQVVEGANAQTLIQAIESFESRVGTPEHALLRRLGLLVKPSDIPEPVQLMKLYQDFVDSEKEGIERAVAKLESELADQGLKPADIAKQGLVLRETLARKLPNLRGYADGIALRINGCRKAFGKAKEILGGVPLQ